MDKGYADGAGEEGGGRSPGGGGGAAWEGGRQARATPECTAGLLPDLFKNTAGIEISKKVTKQRR